MHKPTPSHTYDPAAKVYRDADGHVVVDQSGTAPAAPLTAAQLTTAAAFGYLAEATPDILRVGPGGTSDEEVSSKAHTDIAAAFTVDQGARV
jgi:hypothetical protein